MNEPTISRNTDSTALSTAPSRGHVVIVEDEPDLAALLEYHLQKDGFTTRLAGDGRAALALIEKEMPDAVLLDIMLPDIDGWQICNWIRSQPDQRLASIPIIMQTALGSQEDKVKGLSGEADAYIPKPYSIQEILLTTRRLAASNRNARRLSSTICTQQKKLEIQQALQDVVLHELRGVSSMIGGLTNLLRKKIDNADKEVKEGSANFLQAISSGARYLEGMGRNLSVLARLSTGPADLPKETVRLAEYLETLLHRYIQPALEKGIALSCYVSSADPVVTANPLALEIILGNLIENAIKYSEKSSTVIITARERGGGGIEISVRDQGIGISKEALPHIFERFYRADPSASRKGSGLGLYIVRLLVHNQGGTITVDSVPGRGSVFTVVLPH